MIGAGGGIIFRLDPVLIDLESNGKLDLFGELITFDGTVGDEVESGVFRGAASSLSFLALCGILKLVALSFDPRPRAKLAKLVDDELVDVFDSGGVFGFEVDWSPEVCLN